jgi:hypothetical protein
MKQFLLLLLPLFFGVSLHAQEVHHRVRIDLEQHSLQELSRLQLGIDHGHHVAGEYLVSDVGESALQKLRAAGVPYRIIIPDVGDWYARQNEQVLTRNDDCDNAPVYPYPRPENYQDGSMGGYFTYEEMLAELGKMVQQYPDLITTAQPIGDFTSVQGRPILWLRVSDEAQTDEAEPEVLYTALHHAREPNSLSQMIFFLWYLLENYGQDPEVTYLVDETELYFIPCINPDGYIFNEENNPNGGGLWRKNLSEIDGVPFGVDLNRNYGYEWGFDDNGSSSNPNSQVYRGPEPFSEPETQAVKFFCEQHEFQIALNYHTHGDLLIHPWGYNDQPTEEDPIFKGLGAVMTDQNDFKLGTATETVGYIVNGVSDDWMYGEQETKPKTYAYTPEVGGGGIGFWPPASEIERLNKSCVWQNLAAAHLLHHYVEVVDYAEAWLEEPQGTFQVDLQRFGLSDGNVIVEATAASPNVEVVAAQQSYSLFLLEESTYSFNYLITPGEELLEPVQFAIHIDNGLFVKTDTIKLEYLNGTLEPIFTEAGTTNEAWTASDGWNLTSEDFTSPPTSWTDSPGASYAPGSFNTLTTNEPIALTEGEASWLQFNARWAIEEGYDYAQLRISTDGNTWQPLCGQHTQSGDGFFLPLEPLYSGEQADWVQEFIDLSEYAGQSVYFQFLLAADDFIELDGFYFDDFEVITIKPLPTSTASVSASAKMLKAYPNPANDWLFVETPAQDADAQQELQLFNSLGQVAVRQNTRYSAKHYWQMPMASLPEGLYILQYLVDGKVQGVERIIK